MPYVQKSDRPKKKRVEDMTPQEKAEAFPNTVNPGAAQPVSKAIGDTQLTKPEYEAARARLGFEPTPGAQEKVTPKVAGLVQGMQQKEAESAANFRLEQQAVTNKVALERQQAQAATQGQQAGQVLQQLEPQVSPTSQIPVPSVQTPRLDSTMPVQGGPQTIGAQEGTSLALGATSIGAGIVAGAGTGAAVGALGGPIGITVGSILGGILGGASAAVARVSVEKHQDVKEGLTTYNVARKNQANIINGVNAGYYTPQQAIELWRTEEDMISKAEQAVQFNTRNSFASFLSDGRDELTKISNYNRFDKARLRESLARAIASPDVNAPILSWTEDNLPVQP